MSSSGTILKMSAAMQDFNRAAREASVAVRKFRDRYVSYLKDARIGDDIGPGSVVEIVKRTSELCRIMPDTPHAHVVTTLDEYCGPLLSYSI